MRGKALKVLAVLGVLLPMSYPYIIGDKLLSKAYYVPGDLNVGGIFPVTTYSETAICGVSDFERTIKTLEIVETLAFAVEKINEDPTLLPGIKLGYVFLDSCSNHRAGVLQAIRFLPRLHERDNWPTTVDNFLMSYKVIGVIGTSNSHITIPVSILLGGAGIPLVSFADGSDELSNKKVHPSFLRLMPPDAVHIMAILSFMRHNGWMYFSILIQDDDYGRINAKELARISTEFGMCTSFVRRVSDKDDFKLIGSVLIASTAKVVVSLISHSAFFKLIKALKDLKAFGKLILIGSDRFLEHLPFNEVLEGAFAVSSFPLELEGLNKYLSRADFKRNPWVVPEVLGKSSCNDSDCPHFLLRLNLGKLTLATPGIYDSMMTYAHGLRGLFDDLCPRSFIPSNFSSHCYYKNYGKLIRYMKGINFTGASGQVNFNEKGDRLTEIHIYQSVRKHKNPTSKTPSGNVTILVQRVAYYHIKESKLFSFNNLTLNWTRFNLNNLQIQTECQIPCLPNEYKSSEINCCWNCRKCQPNEMVTDNGTACVPCPSHQWPALVNDKLSTCELIEPTVFNWVDPLSMTILTANGLGVLMIFFVLAALLLRQEEGEEVGGRTSILVVIQLTAIAWGLMAVPVFLLRPTAFSCNTAHALYLLSFSVFYLALFLRTVNMYRNFITSDEEKELMLTQTKYILLFSGLIAVIQIITYSILIDQHPIRSISIQPTVSEKLVELVCDIPFPHTIAFLVNSVILLLICSIFSLKSQTDQYGFDQNRFVSMFVVTSLIMWIAFMPAYFTASSHRMRTYFLILAILVNHISALMLIFTSAFLQLCIRRRKESGVVGFGFFRNSHQSGNTFFSSLRLNQWDKGKPSKSKSIDAIKEPPINALDTQNDH